MKSENEKNWYRLLVEGNSMMDKPRAILNVLPHEPRCMFCHTPFKGYGGRLMSLFGRGQSREDPRLCNACIKYGQEHPGGAYVDLAMIFADIRGSTPLAEQIGDREFSRLIDRFFQTASRLLIQSGAILDRLAGDEVIGFFVPGMAGARYASRALECARNLLKETGHSDPEGPWVSIGVGVHFGNAFVGMVGSNEVVSSLTALGDEINVGARIASAAGPGELLASLSLCRQADVEMQGLEHRILRLKGKQEPMEVVVIPLR